MNGIATIAILMAIFLIAVVIGLVSRYRVPAADEAFVVTGTGKGSQGKVYRGTGTFVLPVVQKATRVSLSAVQADLRTSTPANDGIMLNVAAVAQIKVGEEPTAVLKAAQRFRDDLDQIRNFVTDQLSGELRSIVGTMTAKNILADRQKLTDSVASSVKATLELQGLALDSFTISDVSDNDNTYFNDLSATERAKQAQIAAEARSVAQAGAAKVAAEENRRAEEARIANEQAVIEKTRELQVQTEQARQVVETSRAEANAAGPLKEAERKILQTEKDIEVAEKTALLRNTQLDAEVKRPAEARRYETEQQAEAEKAQRIAEAEAEATSTKLRGEADAQAIRVKGEAEAGVITARAEALAKMDTVGQLELILTKMPAIVSAAAAPLASANLTLIGSDTDAITSSVAKNATGALAAIKSTTGIDLAGMLSAMGPQQTEQLDLPATEDTL